MVGTGQPSLQHQLTAVALPALHTQPCFCGLRHQCRMQLHQVLTLRPPGLRSLPPFRLQLRLFLSGRLTSLLFAQGTRLGLQLHALVQQPVHLHLLRPTPNTTQQHANKPSTQHSRPCPGRQCMHAPGMAQQVQWPGVHNKAPNAAPQATSGFHMGPLCSASQSTSARLRSGPRANCQSWGDWAQCCRSSPRKYTAARCAA